MIKYLCVVLLALLLAACDQGYTPDSLVGTYGIQDNGKVTPIIQVASVDGKYQLNQMDGHGGWAQIQGDVKPFTKVDLEHAAKTNVSVDMTGLTNGGVAIIRTPPDSKIGDFTTHTGYMMLWMFGPMELQKLQ